MDKASINQIKEVIKNELKKQGKETEFGTKGGGKFSLGSRLDTIGNDRGFSRDSQAETDDTKYSKRNSAHWDVAEKGGLKKQSYAKAARTLKAQK